MLWESAGAFFHGDNSLVSARNSHSSGVRGLVSIPKQKVLTFFGTMRLPPPFRLCETFQKFLMSLNGPPFNLFDILQQTNVNPKGSDFLKFVFIEPPPQFSRNVSRA